MSNQKSIHNVSPLGRENAEKQLQSPKFLIMEGVN